MERNVRGYGEYRMRTSFDADSTITDAAEAADSRRSIRRYDSARIPEADLRELLRLAGRAPSAFNAQPWRFVVVQDAELKSRLSAAAYGQQQIVRAPATIVMYSDMRDALQRMPESSCIPTCLRISAMLASIASAPHSRISRRRSAKVGASARRISRWAICCCSLNRNGTLRSWTFAKAAQ